MQPAMQHCPICQKTVQPSERYPRYLCAVCAAKARSKDGRALIFSNESISGGYLAYYADTHESYPSHECFVDGIRCHADEHYYGGIVIQPN
jgi:hypothetical protein